MTRWLLVAGPVLGLTASGMVGTAAASMASIVAVAPVENEERATVAAAATSALERAVRGAHAMGSAEVMLKSVRLVPGTGVVVEIVVSESGARPPGDPGEGEDVERSSVEREKTRP